MLVHQRVTVVLSEAHPPWPGVGRGALRAAPGGEAAQRPRGATGAVDAAFGAAVAERLGQRDRP